MGKLYLGNKEIGILLEDRSSRILSSDSNGVLTSTNEHFVLPAGAKKVPAQMMRYKFYYDPAVKTVDLNELEQTTGDQAFHYCFSNCPNLEYVDFGAFYYSNHTSAFQNCFANCPKLTTVIMNNVATLTGQNVFNSIFMNCTSLRELRFPALTNVGTRNNGLNNMLGGCTDVVVHFRQDIQTSMEKMGSYPSFGGTNTTVLFDL